jgi:hypothetical protein
MGNGKGDWSPAGPPQPKPKPSRKTKRQIDREAEWKRKMRFIENYTWKPPKEDSIKGVDWAALKKQKQDRLRELQERINLQVQVYLTQWKNEVDSAIDQAPFPPEEESRFGFYLALAGNLLWAATSLINPAAAIGSAIAVQGSRIIQVMSFTGATVGSGTITTFFPNRPVSSLSEKDGKDLIRQVAGIEATELQDVFREVTPQWANELDEPLAEFAGSDQQRLEMFEKRIWERVFPRIPFDDNRLNAIRNKCKDNVAKLLVEYRKQWKEFRRIQMSPGPSAEALWAYGTLALKPTVFTPKLDIALTD